MRGASTAVKKWRPSGAHLGMVVIHSRMVDMHRLVGSAEKCDFIVRVANKGGANRANLTLTSSAVRLHILGPSSAETVQLAVQLDT